MKTVHFWLKYNGLAIVRKTTKLIESGHHGLQDYRHICYYFYVFLRFFTFFSKSNPKSRDFLRYFFAVFRTFSRTMHEPSQISAQTLYCQKLQSLGYIIAVESLGYLVVASEIHVLKQ